MSDKLGKMITNVIEVEKNGVKVVIKQQYNKEINDINIDFSEHDKVFEDKIAKLEEELKEWKAEARKNKKNRDEQLKSFRKAVEPYIDIGHMHETIAELKQRIAELESKETEKLTKINLNDRIKVKLTPLGAEIYYHQYDDIHKDYPKMKKHLQSSLPKVDENGYTEFQLWHFMELYGKHIGMCKPNVISPLDIVVSE